MKGENGMEAYLLRHGAAEEARPSMSDADRSLTADGRRKLQQVLQAAKLGDTKPTLILSSPLKRAVQTAEIAKRVLGYKGEILSSTGLVPGATVEQAWDEIRAHRDEPSLLLVGHNPLFENLAPYLLHSPGLQMDFKKGSIVRIDFESFPAEPRGILRWYLVPKLASPGS
jgi:phosphohistidine phosphatase